MPTKSSTLVTLCEQRILLYVFWIWISILNDKINHTFVVSLLWIIKDKYFFFRFRPYILNIHFQPKISCYIQGIFFQRLSSEKYAFSITNVIQSFIVSNKYTITIHIRSFYIKLPLGILFRWEFQSCHMSDNNYFYL